MYKLFRLNEYYYKYYGLLIDSESIEDQLEDIYMSLENILGESFSIIIDTFIRTGYNYNKNN